MSASSSRRPSRSTGSTGPLAWVIGGLMMGWIIVWAGQTLFETPAAGQSGGGMIAHARWELAFSMLMLPDELFRPLCDGPVTLGGIGDRLRVVGVVGLVMIPGGLLGVALLVASGFARRCQRVERTLLGLAVGMSIHSTAVLGLGLVHVLKVPGVMAGLAIAELGAWWCFGGARLWREKRLSLASWGQSGRLGLVSIKRFVRGYPLASGLLAVASVLVGLRSMIPPTEFDVLEYHLGAVKQWFQSGGIGFMAENVYANMPMGAEMQSLSAIAWAATLGIEPDWWWGAIAGKAIMFVYWALTLGLSACAVRRLVSRDAAVWLLVVGASGPAFAEVTVLGLIEPAVACFFAAGLLTLVVSMGHSDGRRATMFWAGFFGGSALACKYPALVFVALPLALGAWFATRAQGDRVDQGDRSTEVLPSAEQSRRRPQAAVLCFILGAAITGGPWLMKNALLAGNPVYPLAAGIFGGKTLSEAKVDQWQSAHRAGDRRIGLLVGKLYDFAFSWRSQGALLLPLALMGLGLPSTRSTPMSRAMLAGLALFTMGLWWAVTHHLYRFLLPSIPIALLAAGLGIAWMFDSMGRRWATVLLSAAVGLNLVILIASPTMGDPRIAVDLSSMSDESRSKTPNLRVADHVRWINRHLSQKDRVLIVGDAAIFYYQVPVSYSTCFDRSPLAEIAAAEPSQWGKEFARRGITWMLIDWGEIDRYRQAGNYGFDDAINKAMVQRMVDRGVIEPMETGLKSQVVDIYRVPR